MGETDLPLTYWNVLGWSLDMPGPLFTHLENEGSTRPLCFQECIIATPRLPPHMHMFSGTTSVKLPDAKQMMHLNPPSSYPTHHLFIVIIIYRIIVFVIQGQVSLVGSQEHVLPSHGVSQVEDQILMETEPTECTTSNLMTVPAPRAMAIPRGQQGLCRMSALSSL